MLETPSPSSFSTFGRPFLVVEDEQGCAFGLVDLRRIKGEVVIESFTYISPADADVTNQVPQPARFRKYKIQGPRVLFMDRNEQIEARIELIPWRGTRPTGGPDA